MFAPRVVHLSSTPLVGAPAKITRCLRRAGIPAECVIIKDYPGALAGKFLLDTMVWEGVPRQLQVMIEGLIQEADIIHVHNDLPISFSERIISIAPNALYVYQVHSPLREGPLYVERTPHLPFPFEAHLVVGQYQPRQYPTHIPVPNLVDDITFFSPRKAGEKLRVLFSPSHTREGRWNRKSSAHLEKLLSNLSSMKSMEIIKPDKPLDPSTLFSIRRQSHVSIDEIFTGAFHQISIEGLCAGNVVINAADYFSKSMMAWCSGADHHPPFLYADETTLADTLIKLAADHEYTVEIQRMSHEYFKKYLRPDLLINRFIDVYKGLTSC